MARGRETTGDLSDDELRAWRGLLAVMLVGMPQVERTFRERGLVQVEYGLLVGLARSPEGQRLGDLATVMNMSASRLSHRMAKLVERGYVSLRPSAEDGRVTMAEITAEGRRLMAEVAPEHLRELRRVIFDHLTRSQTAALADALETVGNQLGACVGEHPGPQPPPACPPGPRLTDE